MGLESTLKVATENTRHEASIREDGSFEYEGALSLESYSKGLQLLYGTSGTTAKSVPDFKLGFEYIHTDLRAQVSADLRSLACTAHLTYLAQSNLAVGGCLVLEPQISSVSTYDFGLSWSPSTNAIVALKHESANKARFEIGTVKLILHNYASDRQTIGTEFALDWQRWLLQAKVGL